MVLLLHGVPDVNELAILKYEESMFLCQFLQSMDRGFTEISDDVSVNFEHCDVRTDF